MEEKGPQACVVVSQVEKEAILWPTGTRTVCVYVLYTHIDRERERRKKWEWRALQHTAKEPSKQPLRVERFQEGGEEANSL